MNNRTEGAGDIGSAAPSVRDSRYEFTRGFATGYGLIALYSAKKPLFGHLVLTTDIHQELLSYDRKNVCAFEIWTRALRDLVHFSPCHDRDRAARPARRAASK